MQFSAKGHSVCAQLLTATKDKVPLFFGETTATQGQESSCITYVHKIPNARLFWQGAICQV